MIIFGLLVTLGKTQASRAQVESWNANFYRPQSRELVTSIATRSKAKGLSYQNLSRFETVPDPEVSTWTKVHKDYGYPNADDYRVAFNGRQGWYLVNRYGYSHWKGRTASFAVGKFVHANSRQDELQVRFVNHSEVPLQLFTFNGIPVCDLPANGSYRWVTGWNTGIIGRNASRKIGF